MAHHYHFQHHLIEARRNYIRLVMAVGAITVATIGFMTPAIFSYAATATTADLDGVKILNSGTGTYGGTSTGPFASAKVSIKRVKTGSTSSSTGNPFSFKALSAPAAGEHYIVSVSPTAVPGYTVKGLTWCKDACTGYKPQTTNFKAGSSVDFTFYGTHVYHMRWIYQPIPKATPTHVPTPKPTVAPTPVPTVKPVPTPTPKRGTATPVRATPAPAVQPAPTSAPVAVPLPPANFQALSASDNAVITLSWAAPAGAEAVAGYTVERSLDQASWQKVADKVSSLAYTDDTVAFGLHYYYRLSAVDAGGVVLGVAHADGTTATFSPNSAGSDAITVESDDKLATVDVPAGALGAETACSIVASSAKLGTNTTTVVAGPFTLVCKTFEGNVVTDFAKPVTWTYRLDGKLKNLGKPGAVALDSAGEESGVSEYNYDAKTKLLTFNQAGATTTAAVASAKSGLPTTFIVLFVTAFLVIAGVVILMLRRSQHQNYNDYLRSKYYNL